MQMNLEQERKEIEELNIKAEVHIATGKALNREASKLVAKSKVLFNL